MTTMCETDVSRRTLVLSLSVSLWRVQTEEQCFKHECPPKLIAISLPIKVRFAARGARTGACWVCFTIWRWFRTLFELACQMVCCWLYMNNKFFTDLSADYEVIGSTGCVSLYHYHQPDTKHRPPETGYFSVTRDETSSLLLHQSGLWQAIRWLRIVCAVSEEWLNEPNYCSVLPVASRIRRT